MSIGASASSLRQMKWSEAAWRFVLGSLITAGAAWVAHAAGPRAGGLFLAFPAILPASLTLVSKHQQRRKAQLGLHGLVRGRQAAALDALGACLGAAGLCGFALTVRALAVVLRPAAVLMIATAVWLVIASIAWWLRKRGVLS